jgi:RimJ/RimL family protein N-acetyltransferase
MNAKTSYATLTLSDVEELVPVLHSEEVFAFIGGMPTRNDFTLGLRRAIDGPGAKSVGEHWINYAVRLNETGELIGRVEATVHDNLAEVAFLFNPAVWGCGYATEGLYWLHGHLRDHYSIPTVWATTHPKNARSGALLRKVGYVQTETQRLPMLYTYDEGDLVFQRSLV